MFGESGVDTCIISLKSKEVGTYKHSILFNRMRVIPFTIKPPF